jgi:hypothetical protein
MASTPTHFLIPNPPNPAKVDQTGDWHTIIGVEKLTETDDSTEPSEGAAPLQDANVSFTSGNFWGLNFTSEANLAYFVTRLSVDTLLNTAWIGDGLDCPSAEADLMGYIC